jgi:thiamine phosphate synthase YjbQ (UPF0047 family)
METQEAPGLVDITRLVEETLIESQINEGRVVVYSESSCPIVVNELESGLVSDLKKTLDRLGVPGDGLARRIGSASVVLPAHDGELKLGVWQRVLLLELEQGCARRVSIQITGD